MRKMPKYNPIRAGEKQSLGHKDIAMGFMAVIMIMMLVAGGAVALTLTGLFAPAVVENPLIETPADRLNINPPPTVAPAASGRSVAAAGSSSKVSGLSDEQRQQMEQEVRDRNRVVFGHVGDDWEVADVVQIIEEMPPNFKPADYNVTVKKNDLNPNPALPDTWYNVLLLGTDDRSADAIAGRTDVMMIASMNSRTGEIKLSSLARDLYLEIPMLNGKNRLNTAHAYGGPNLAMKAVNTLFDMNVTRYVRVNLHGLVDIISIFGGVDIDLQPGEAEQINYNVAVSEDYEGFVKNPDRVPLKKDQVGVSRLDPLQALGYARIRHLDNDFYRTNRQRVLLDKILQMVLDNQSAPRMLSIVSVMLEHIGTDGTNLPFKEIVSTGMPMISAGIKQIESLSIPVEGSFKYVQESGGESVLEANLKTNKEALHKFIYGEYYPRPAQ